jgi:alkylation response protein AidB-like acyl-CoA dehydrogenase
VSAPGGGDPGDGSGASVAAIGHRLRRLIEEDFFELPAYGEGQSAHRLLRLSELARADLALARLAEAHLDALTILAEANMHPEPGAAYGVWASEGGARLQIHRVGGGWQLRGRKAFCTGCGIVDRALVTARDEGSTLLVDLDVTRVRGDTDGWSTDAFAETNTATVEFAGLRVGDAQRVGGPNWYLDRTGFWHGALAPAACWAGGAIGLADHCVAVLVGGEPDGHTSGRLGTLDATAWELSALLRAAGDAIDEDPTREAAIAIAHRCRTMVERSVSSIVDDAVRAVGPRLLAFDEWAGRRVAELQLYVRQHHDRRDHAALGELVRARRLSTEAGSRVPER